MTTKGINMARKFNFELAILGMNAMYNLPIAQYPSFQKEIEWQAKTFPKNTGIGMDLVVKRLKDFFAAYESILADELTEHKSIIQAIDDEKNPVDILVELADLLGDIQVYCASEMARFGIPNEEVLKIIMESNESKLGADGKPIYNEQGKFMKGPNYWKPEPRIRELLVSLLPENAPSFGHDDAKS